MRLSHASPRFNAAGHSVLDAELRLHAMNKSNEPPQVPSVPAELHEQMDGNSTSLWRKNNGLCLDMKNSFDLIVNLCGPPG